jgi:hypothetical protein
MGLERAGSAAADKGGLGSARHLSERALTSLRGRFVRLRRPIVDKHLRIAS